MTTTRVRNPHGEGSRLREELIAAAGRVLAAAPDADLSLRAVAREAGVAAPSVYLQFADKTQLVGAVIAHYFEQLREAVVNAVATAAEPADRLRAGCLAYCRFGLERPGAYQVLFAHEAPVAHTLGRFGDLDDAGTRAFATLIDAIGDCMTAGIVRPGDPFRLATLFWSAMHGYVSLVQLQRGFPWQPVEEFVDDLITAFINAPAAPADPDREQGEEGRRRSANDASRHNRDKTIATEP